MHKAAVAEAPEHPDDPHGFGEAHPALGVVVRDVQPLVQAAFNAPARRILLGPAGGVELRRRQAAHQRDDFRGVVAQVSPQKRDLCDAGEIHFLGRRRAGAQHAQFLSAFVDLPLACQLRRRIPRGKNAPAALPLIFQCEPARWDEFVARGGAAELFLGLQEKLVQRVVANVLHHPAEGGLAGGGIATIGLRAHAS